MSEPQACSGFSFLSSRFSVGGIKSEPLPSFRISLPSFLGPEESLEIRA